MSASEHAPEPEMPPEICTLCHEPILPIEATRNVVQGPFSPEALEAMKLSKPYKAKVRPAHLVCTKPVTLTCACCGFEETFKNCEEAFQAGWDEPTHLASWPLSCPLCPGTASMGMFDHSAAHERWKREGRPANFTESQAHDDAPDIPS